MSQRALVIGAGPAGLAGALRLAPCCESVTVVEARPRGALRQAGEHLPPVGIAAFRKAGLGGALADGRHGASSGVRSAWGEADPLDRDYVFSRPATGLNLHRAALDKSLSAAAERAGVRVLYDTRLLSLERVGSSYHARFSTRHARTEQEAEMVIDASGRRAVGARRLGARRLRCDAMIGLAGRLAMRGASLHDDPGRLLIEAAPDGWWYAVHLGATELLAVYMTDAGCLRASGEGALAFWRRRLTESPLVARLAQGAALPDRIDAFDAATQILEPCKMPGFLAAGDAAAAYDPLSSWGIAKGVADGQAAADALLRARAGDAGAVTGHRNATLGAFAQHLGKRAEVYGLERRWPALPFWAARHVPARRAVSSPSRGHVQ